MAPKISSLILIGTLWACNDASFENLGQPKSSGDDKEDQSPTPDDGNPPDGGKPGTDVPTWVNGAYLTCNWDGIESTSDIAVFCSVATESGKKFPAPEDDLKVSYEVRNEKDEVVLSGDWAPGSASNIKSKLEGRLILPASKIEVFDLIVRISYGETKQELRKKFREILPVTPKVGEFSVCYIESGGVPSECIDHEGKIEVEGEAEEEDDHEEDPEKPKNHRIFVTSQLFRGNELGGARGADEKCQAVATAASLNGHWRAVLSTAMIPALERVRVLGPVYNMRPKDSGGPVMVVQDLPSLLLGFMNARINYTEAGVLTESEAWTGTGSDGAPKFGMMCGNWGEAPESVAGWVGKSDRMGRGWIDYGQAECSTELPLYCVDGQKPPKSTDGN